MYGWIFGKNVELDMDKNWNKRRCGECWFASNLLNKFPEDIINTDRNKRSYLLDGYVLNKADLVEEYEMSWQETWEKMCEEETPFARLRGAFCGYIYEYSSDEIVIYTDHMGNRAVYYYCSGDNVIISSNMECMVRTLKANGIEYNLDENAVKYMLTYGYMLDNSTFVTEVKRVLPGCCVKIKHGTISQNVYYRMDNRQTVDCTEREAVEKIDAAFRNAIRREFEKDREYGYQHLVDLSGGLDSRMVCWVAHEMGYTNQLNFTYCRQGYLDFEISEKIALDLKHEYLYKPLDDIHWLYDIDETVRKNNGAALYYGITGGNRFLSLLDKSRYGIEHTGMVGDVIPSSFYKEEKIAYSKPRFGMHQYSERLHYDFDEAILENYPNQEIFALFTRGLLGAASSFMIRQNYFETASVFLDVDFLDVCLSLPFKYRAKHNIYLEWIKQKYPAAAEYGWEKWGGVKPLKSHVKYRKVVTTIRLLDVYTRKLFGKAEKNYMNPLDYWYNKDSGIQNYYQKYFEENFGKLSMPDKLKADLKDLYQNGSVYEKGMVLTVLGLLICILM